MFSNEISKNSKVYHIVNFLLSSNIFFEKKYKEEWYVFNVYYLTQFLP